MQPLVPDETARDFVILFITKSYGWHHIQPAIGTVFALQRKQGRCERCEPKKEKGEQGHERDRNI
jgi:hypothetical protein